jgi:hypothetical protein
MKPGLCVVELPRVGSIERAHNPKVAGSNPAPATTIADSRCARSTAGGCQHLSEIPNHLKQSVTGRDHNAVDEAAQTLPRGVPLGVRLVSQCRGELGRFWRKISAI